MNALDYDMQAMLTLAKQEIAQGNALNWIIEQGELSVETDQGWSVWWPNQEPCLYDGY